MAGLVTGSCARCSAPLDIPPEADWDITTNTDGLMVERHIGVPCPSCGFLADHYDDPPEATNIFTATVDPPRPVGE